MKSKWIALVLAAVLCVGSVPVWAEESADTEEKQISFVDVPDGHEAYEAVMSLAASGVVNGKSDTEFAPDDSLKREEFAKILVNAFNLSENSKAPVFNDVPAGTWYANYVRAAAASGLVEGIGSDDFGVGLTLSRQDMALILSRFLERKNVKVSNDNTVVYADCNDIAEYAKVAVEALASAGVLPVGADNCVHPQENASRADAARAIYAALNMERTQALALGRMGPSSQYNPPYDTPLDDKLAQMMPTPFDPSAYPSVLMMYEDFEDGEFAEGAVRGNMTDDIASYVSAPGIGYNGSNGCIQLELTGQKAAFGQIAFTSSDLKVGDYIFMSCYYKGTGISVQDTKAQGYRPIAQIYDDTPKWIRETNNGRKSADSDWIYWESLLEITGELNDLTPPESHTVRFGAYSTTGTLGKVYVDDLRIEKVVMDPMDTMLISPGYKGLIYGDDGVGDIHVRAHVRDGAGYYSFDNFRLKTTVSDGDGKEYFSSVTETVTPTTDLFYSSKTLPMGSDYYVKSSLQDKTTDEVICEQEWILRKREADYRPKVYIDEYHRMIRDGEPVLPVSMQNGTTYDDYWDDIKNREGINYFAHNGMGWYFNYGKEQYHGDIMKKVEDSGKWVQLSTGNYIWDQNIMLGEVKNKVEKQSDLRGMLTRLINNFKDYEPLLFYYISDELDPVKYGREAQWMNDIIGTVDIDHPTTGAVDKVDRTHPGIRSKMMDFILTDPYPCTGKPDQDLSLVYTQMQELKELNPNRAIATFLQGFWYDRRGDLRAPNQQEYRNMAFQGLCAGSCLFTSFAYRWNKEHGTPGVDTNELHADYFDVLEELEYISPIYLSVEPAPYYEVKGGGDWLNSFTKRYDGESYLFVVNNQNVGKKARVYLDGATKITGMYTGEVFEADEAGLFDLALDAYEVEIFRYEQADYKSSHAELSWFGITGGETGYTMLEADSDVSTFVVPADVNEVEYAVTVSDFATVTINGAVVEKKGTLVLGNSTELLVKVTSEDGRFSTEKRFKIERY